MTNIDWQPFILSLELALIVTVMLLLISIPISYYLAYSNSVLRSIVDASVNIPLILPPTVLGYYFIVIFKPDSFLGRFFKNVLGLDMVFSFEAVVLASVIYSLPLMTGSLKSGFEGVPKSLSEASYTLGKGKFVTLLRVLLPNIKPAIITSIVMTFAHTIGGFGIVFMVGGNIPGKTKVASTALYSYFNSLDYKSANIYALILFAMCFLFLLLINLLKRKTARRV
jgi:molybdate transport system permease protein